MITAIIPARGGSKGIPRKNLVYVLGVPLIAWSIRQALECSLIDEVIVATDDHEIANVAFTEGAFIEWRSIESATDDAPSELAIIEAINRFSHQTDEAIVFLQATSPCRVPGDLDSAIRFFRETKCDSVFSARHVEGYLWRSDRYAAAPQALHGYRKPRQQHTEQHLEENGSFYIASPKVFLAGSRHGAQPRAFVMHPLDSLQIDEPQDIATLEAVMEMRLGRHATTPA